MDRESEIRFEGPGPFHLPVAQSAAVQGHENSGVTIMLECVLPDRGGRPETVSVQMLTKVAHDVGY